MLGVLVDVGVGEDVGVAVVDADAPTECVIVIELDSDRDSVGDTVSVLLPLSDDESDAEFVRVRDVVRVKERVREFDLLVLLVRVLLRVLELVAPLREGEPLSDGDPVLVGDGLGDAPTLSVEVGVGVALMEGDSVGDGVEVSDCDGATGATATPRKTLDAGAVATVEVAPVRATHLKMCVVVAPYKANPTPDSLRPAMLYVTADGVHNIPSVADHVPEFSVHWYTL